MIHTFFNTTSATMPSLQNMKKFRVQSLIKNKNLQHVYIEISCNAGYPTPTYVHLRLIPATRLTAVSNAWVLGDVAKKSWTCNLTKP